MAEVTLAAGTVVYVETINLTFIAYSYNIMAAIPLNVYRALNKWGIQYKKKCSIIFVIKPYIIKN